MMFFDNKPLIVKAWEPDTNFYKEYVVVVPTWIQLNVDFKYWNVRCLEKFVAQIGKFVKVDQATKKREKLQFARIMVEVKIDQDFLDQFFFIDKKGRCGYGYR